MTPNLMVVYFRGLPPNKDLFRIDICRHFEGLPRSELQDFVSVAKRGPAPKTLDYVKNQSHDTRLHAQDLDDAEVLEKHIKPIVHALPQDSTVVATLPKDDSHWYDKLTHFLPKAGQLAGGAIGSYFKAPAIGAAIGGMSGSMAEAYLE